MIFFETDKKPLTFLLDQIENRYLALPDFQRSFVWDPNATRELVVSIIRSFPAGTLLQLEGGYKMFAPRAFEEAPPLNGNPTHLILDGQQRMTSLYQAFAGRGTHRFFLNVRELLDGLDTDETVEVYTTQRAHRWETLEQQAQSLMLPLKSIRDFSDWKDEILDLLEEQGQEVKKLKKQLNEIEKDYVDPVKYYNFPVTTLSSSTPVEAVCTIFETLNRTGVKLSVFELLTARAFAHDIRLRDMWHKALSDFPVIQDFEIDPYYVLQIIAVSVKGSPKRSVVLGLEIDDIVEEWQRAVRGLSESLKLLRDECGVLVAKWVPYTPMLITLASAWRGILDVSGPAVGARRAKLTRWFWCASFAQWYENSANSTTERDVPELLAWLNGEAEPTVVASFRFNSGRWREITVRQRALYRASIALLMRKSPRDFHKGNRLSKPIIDGDQVDDHHVFPRAFLASTVKGKIVDSVLNHTLIDRKTNIKIGGRAPSKYLAEMEAELGNVLTAILKSHGLPSDSQGPLFTDQFDEFLDWRLHHMELELRDLTGGEVGEEVAPMELASDDGWEAESAPTDWRENSQIEDLLDAFDLRGRRGLLERFIDEVSKWQGVRVWAGTGRIEGRAIHFSRKGSPFGAFCRLQPRVQRVRLRLSPEDLDETSFADFLDRKDPYRTRVELGEEAAVDEALNLADIAYNQAK